MYSLYTYYFANVVLRSGICYGVYLVLPGCEYYPVAVCMGMVSRSRESLEIWCSVLYKEVSSFSRLIYQSIIIWEWVGALISGVSFRRGSTVVLSVCTGLGVYPSMSSRTGSKVLYSSRLTSLRCSRFSTFLFSGTSFLLHNRKQN